MMEQSTILARIEDRGFARICPTGCIHISYGPVTLDFARDGFEKFARMLRCFQGECRKRFVEVQYDRATLRFTGEEFGEFVNLVAEAHSRLTGWDGLAVSRPEGAPLLRH